MQAFAHVMYFNVLAKESQQAKLKVQSREVHPAHNETTARERCTAGCEGLKLVLNRPQCEAKEKNAYSSS